MRIVASKGWRRFVRNGLMVLAVGVPSLGLGAAAVSVSATPLLPRQPATVDSGSSWDRFAKLEAHPEVHRLEDLATRISLLSGFHTALRTVMIAETGETKNPGHSVEQELTLPDGKVLSIRLTLLKGKDVGQREVNKVQERCLDYCGSVIDNGYGFWEVAPSTGITTIVAMATDRPDESITVVISGSPESQDFIAGAQLVASALND